MDVSIALGIETVESNFREILLEWKMLFVIVVTVIVAYIIYTLISSYGSEYESNTFDAFIDTTPSVTDKKDEVLHSDREPQSITGSEMIIEQETAVYDASNLNVAASTHYHKNYNTPGKQVLIVYGTEYGFSKEVAREVYDRILELPHDDGVVSTWQPRCINARHFQRLDLMQEAVLLVTMSTAGDGVPPTDARDFVNWLDLLQTSLSHLNFSVLALGDSSYLHFCRAGQAVDLRLQELGANRFVARRDVDAEDRQTIADWTNEVIQWLPTLQIEMKHDYLTEIPDEDEENANHPTREQPLFAVLKTKYDVSAPLTADFDKEIIHCEFDVSNSNLHWTSGDALGIYPQNNAVIVREILKFAQWNGTELIDVPSWAYRPVPGPKLPLETVLMLYYDLKTIKPELLLLLCRKSQEGAITERLQKLLQDGLFKTNHVLNKYLSEREVVDVVADFHTAVKGITPGEFVRNLRSLVPRYYSISSSPVVDPATVCVTAAIIRYQTIGRDRQGVATTFMQDRLTVGQVCPIFISRNPDFRLPTNVSLPIIMVGPGTGFAPFRAFLQERIATHSTGKNLLYYGCRRKEQDFIYRQELERWVKDSKLKLRTAFSRDQQEKVYVQDLLRADAADIWHLLDEAGAHLYVCGDARRMAMDVHRAILDIAIDTGGMGELDAVEFVYNLELTGRYQKDVWIS